MTERAARLVDHILQVAKPGDTLYSYMTRGPETEDTTHWVLTASGDVHVTEDMVYPGMASVFGPERTISIDDARQEILAALLQADTDGSLVPYFERRWRMEWRFRLVNAFCIDHERLSGSPSCVFEDARGLTGDDMQKLARQMNLSETAYLFPSQVGASRRVRTFTPTFEVPFAGHATLGCAQVVRAVDGCGDAVRLEMQGGVVDVRARGDTWTLLAARPPQTRPAPPRADLARMLQLDEAALLDDPLWVDTGTEHLVIRLRSFEDVARARPDTARLSPWMVEQRGSRMAYVWARDGGYRVAARGFSVANGAIVEDPATGSGCANLGAWHIATKQALPVTLYVSQGAQIGRPSRLTLRVDAGGAIAVSGEVIELARGAMSL